MDVVVFTDLDGTLLDVESYSWEPARGTLARLEAAGVPVVPVTSKTRAEVEPLMAALGLDGPFIVENGGAIFVPAGTPPAPIPGARRQGRYEVVPLGAPYAALRARLTAVRQAHGASLVGFGDLSVEEVVAATGLPPEAAALAKRREYDEPFRLDAAARRPEVLEALTAGGLRITEGAHFAHLTGAGDKGAAVRRLADAYRRLRPALVTVGAGDGPNDIPLLAAVGRPLLVPRPDGTVHPALTAALPGAAVAPAPGPVGWALGITRLVGGPVAAPGEP
jgi:mannosyl-3-phosphoglycerate phosphatase family protein